MEASRAVKPVFDFDFNKYMENLQPAQKSLEFEINEEGVFNAIFLVQTRIGRRD